MTVSFTEEAVEAGVAEVDIVVVGELSAATDTKVEGNGEGVVVSVVVEDIEVEGVVPGVSVITVSPTLMYV